jgi:membrane protein required for colicin V production
MNMLDIILLVPLLWFAYRGFRRGLIIELASLAALLLGIFAAIHFSWFAGELLEQYFSLEEKYLAIISFAVTFIVVVLIVYSIGKLIEKMIDMVALGFVNKSLGAVFGVFKAVLVLSVVLLVITSLDKQEKVLTDKAKEKSILYEPVASVVLYIIPRLDLQQYDIWEKIEKEADSAMPV